MSLVHCESCRYNFEAAAGEEDPKCRLCGGPTRPAANAPQAIPSEGSKTLKIEMIPLSRPVSRNS